MSNNFTHLLSPGRIGAMELRNRVVLAAMGSNFANHDGSCSERLIAYYEARAKGGTGLLVLETSAACYPNGATMPNMVGFSKEEFLPGLTQLAERVHAQGSKIVAQLCHGGKMAQEDTAAGRSIPMPTVMSPGFSDMFNVLTQEEIGHFIKAAGPDGKGPKYYEMTQQHIDETVAGFANAASIAQRAGFDGVELHAGHGYLIASFLSPHYNKRTDNYGGSRENRARFLLEIIKAVRAATSPEFAILVRLDAKEYRVDEGIELEDCLVTVKLAEAAGADAIDVSAYGNTAYAIAFTEAPLVHEPCGFIPFAKAVKKEVQIPVIGVGRVEPEQGEQHIAAGDYDFLAMGRKLLADPELPNKLGAGTPEAVRPCIYCYICVSKIFINQAMCCAVNHSMGREHEGDIIARSSDQQKVLVVGGGPGGMEAARLLAEQGHRVSLWEKDRDLGGTARIAGLAYEPNERLVHYLADAVKALPIDLQTGKTATADTIAAEKPDHVVLATGALRIAPDFPGKEQKHVFDGDELRGILFGTNPQAAKKLNPVYRLMLTAARFSQMLRSIKLLRFLSKIWMPIADEVVIIGGGLVGLELAEYLVERGRKITVLEPGASLGAELSIVRRGRVLHMLREHGVQIRKNTAIESIGADSVHYTYKDESIAASCKQVIIAIGAEPDNALEQQLAASGAQVHRIGDCRDKSFIDGAILGARKLAEQLH
jgi:2,4-dienoyl-CoA reductase-like NADH-dependent reductase (Old Yellow Enzyme family)/ribulose 1,5-bisphosphate synthetase/thiazole synthase